MGTDEKRAYSEALLNCSVRRRVIAACPLAFGEVGVKERIRNIVKYKKPALWIVLICGLVCIVTAICFLTNPISRNLDSTIPEDVGVALEERTIPLLDKKSYYDLTAEGKLEVSGLQVGQYQLYTNSTQISVKLSEHSEPVMVYLYDTEYPEVPILQFKAEAGESKETFSNLTASRNYFLAVETEEELTLTVSD